MAERGRDSGNFCCVLNCLAQDDGHRLAQMFSELLGREVTDSECSSGSKLTWHVSNKYYAAEVLLYVHKTVKEAFDSMRNYEALVILCNLSQSDVVDVVSKRWEEFEEQLSPTVCLLVGAFDCEDREAEKNQQELLGWCVENTFELIEWEKNTPTTPANGGNQEDSDEDDDGLPPDPVGICRVSDALQAHMWPNMEMEKKGIGQSVREEEGSSEGGEAATTGGGETEEGERKEKEKGEIGLGDLEAKVAASMSASKDEAKNKVDSLLSAEERLIAEGLDGEKDTGGESFESLFGRFAQMKEHAEALPHEERKQYAEKVVMAFWNAVGGDEDEVKTSDDDNK